MAWAQEIDQARNHLALVLAEVGMAFEDNQKLSQFADVAKWAVSPEQVAFRDGVRDTITELSTMMFEAVRMESVLLPMRRADEKAMKGIWLP